MLRVNAEKFESTIYQKHGLAKIDGNMAEGFVLKPTDALFNENIRVSIKLKNSRHLESAPVLKQPKV